MKKHVKLGPKASSFYDAVTGLKVSPGETVPVTTEQAKSEKFQSAISNRFLLETEAKKVEVKKVEEELDDEDEDYPLDGSDNVVNLKTMKKDELISHLEDEYELTPEEFERAKAMKKDELVAYIESLEDEG